MNGYSSAIGANLVFLGLAKTISFLDEH